MVDTDSLREAVNKFQFYSRPSNASRSAPCTVGDIEKVIEQTAKLFNAFIAELEQSE